MLAHSKPFGIRPLPNEMVRIFKSRASVPGCVAHLTLVVQGREVRKFVLNPTVTTIGRSQDNDIVINNLALSRRHAELHFRSGRYEVEDLGSQNGVFVNNSRIRGPQVLGHEDTVTLGTYHFVFSDDEDKRAPARSPRRTRRAQEVTQLEAPEDLALAGDLADEAELVPLLVLKYNDVELQRFPVMGEEVVIGRAKECDIQIAERRLSRRHCKITREGSGCVLSDLGSQNGSYVNRRRIPQRYTLKHGDLLNFAEYTILFLADAADYDGPDRAPSDPPSPRPVSGIEREETEFPEAYAHDLGYEEPGLQPSIIPRGPRSRDPEPDYADSDSEVPAVTPRRAPPVQDPSEPFVERPVRARERRTQQKGREIHETRRPDPAPERRAPRDEDPPRRAPRDEDPPRRAPRDEEPPRRAPRDEDPPRRAPRDEARRSRRPEPEPEPEVTPPRSAGARRAPVADAPVPKNVRLAPRRRVEHEHRDVDDEHIESRPDSNLDDWYRAREDSEIYQEEPSVLLERSKSSMSQILSTMMVDKRDVDRNLRLEAKERQFKVKVSAGREVIYEGPLEHDVTILGTDAEADILLKGRYVAGRHSLLVQVRDSLLLVRLGSSSAARVNGLPKLQAFLKKGDVVQIDETTIEIIGA